MFTFCLFITILGVTSFVGPLTTSGQSTTIPIPTYPSSNDPNLVNLGVQFQTWINRRKVVTVVNVPNP